MVASVEDNGAMDAEDAQLDVYARAAKQEHELMDRKEAMQAAIKKCKSVRHNQADTQTLPQNESQAQTELEAGEDEMARYKQYQPKELKIGHAHPDHIVESASLATAKPPKIFYKLSPPLEEDWKTRTVSNLQLETVIYAMQRYEGPRLPDGARAGFFLGDGAGVGKGRQIAALIKEMWLKGTRRILWLSHCNDLREDARRDMTDCNIHVKSHHSPPTVKSRKQHRVEIDVWPNGNQAVPACPDNTTLSEMFSADGGDGVIFITYNLLRAGLAKVVPARGEDTPTYSARVFAALQRPNTRFMKILEWLKADRSESGPLIVLDECHKAKNLIPPAGSKPTTTGLAVHQLQKLLPDAAVLYSSATGISEPNNMAYMVRLGTFGFASLRDLIENLKEAGLGASELFACSLKKQGIYLARQLAYDGAEFDLQKVDLEHVFQVQYARSAAMWQLLALLVPKGGCWALTHGRVGSLLWADHQRFFKSMLMAAKVPALADEAKKAVDRFHCVVIGLQSTGEANMQAEKEKGGEVMDQIFSAPKVQISRTVGKYVANQPDAKSTTTDCLRQLTEVVSGLVCFAEHLCGAGSGTAIECAAQLEELAKKDAENRVARLKALRAQKILERKERAARGEPEHESDLEDDDADLHIGEEAQHSLLSCISLAKLTGNYVEQHAAEAKGRALKALVTHSFNAIEAQDWTMSEEEMEKILNETFAKLEDETDRREENERRMKLLADQRHLASKMKAHKLRILGIKKELSELDKPQNANGEVEGGAGGHGRRRSAPVARVQGAQNGAAVAVGLEDDEEEEEGGREAPVATPAKQPAVRQQILDSDDDDDGAPPAPGQNAAITAATKKQVVQTLDDSDSDMEACQPVANASVDRKRLREGDLEAVAGGAIDTEVGGSGLNADEEPNFKSARLNKEGASEQDEEKRAEQELIKSIEELPPTELKALADAVAPPIDIDEMDMCMVCGEELGGDAFASCSWCHQEVHLNCHDPPLESQPDKEDSWYCSRCKDTVRKRNAARGLIARRALRSMNNGGHSTPEAAARGATSPPADAGRLQDLEALLSGGTPELTTSARAGTSKHASTSKGAAGGSPAKARKSASSMADTKVLSGGTKGPVSAASLLSITKPSYEAAVKKDKDMKRALYLYNKRRRTGGAAGKPKDSPAGGKGAADAGSGQKEHAEPDCVAVQAPEAPDDDLRRLLEEKRRLAKRKTLEASLEQEIRNLDAVRRKLGGLRNAQEQEVWPREYSQADAVRGGRKTRSSAGVLVEGGKHFDDDMPEASEPEEEEDVLDEADDDDPEEVDDLFGVKRKLVDKRALAYKDMTRNFSAEEPYDWDKIQTVERPGAKKPDIIRPDPHPVTVKCKVVLRKLIDLLELPPNPLDLLTHLCGGRDEVAEMTGRTEMMEWKPNGQFAAVRRADDGAAQQSLNLKERKRFMDGEKLVAIISDAASTGISLQADKKVKNQRRRIHLTLELPWSADKSIQQFGRTHRSNQASAPIYKLLMTPAAGEYRFASSAARRLQSLGAILKGNRQALGAGQNLKEFDVDHSYGAKAVRQFIGELTGRKSPHGQLVRNEKYKGKDCDEPRSIYVPTLVPPEAGILDHTALTDNSPKAKHVDSMPKLLNRLLGMNLQQQQIIFSYLQQLIDFEIETAKAKGAYESGVLFLERAVRYVESEVVWQQGNDTTKQITLTVLEHDNGLAYEEALALMEQNKDQIEKHGSFLPVKDVGFYIRKYPRNQLGTGYDRITLVTGELRNADAGGRNAAKIIRRNPWQVSSIKVELRRFKDQWKLCENETAAKNLWNFWYKFTENRCQHQLPCKIKQEQGHCSSGNRTNRFRVLHGSLLLAWEPILRYHKRTFEDLDDVDDLDDEYVAAKDPGDGASPGKRKPRGQRDGTHRLEMASTSFKDNQGNEQTLTGLVVRHRILQPLMAALEAHQGGVNQAAQAGHIAAAAQAMVNGAANGAAEAAAMAGAIMNELHQNQGVRNGHAANGPNMKWLQEAVGAEKFLPAKPEPALVETKPAQQPVAAAPHAPLPDPELPTVQFKQELLVKEEQGRASTSAGVPGRRKSLFASLASTSQQQPEAGVKTEHLPLDD